MNARRRPRPADSGGKPVNLALQGGGTHGAFTWGVLDRLLADPRISIEGISGTSAGAMNAIVVAAGMSRGGRDGAREALEGFWAEVSEQAQLSPIRRSPLDILLNNWNLDTSPALLWFDLMSRVVSPYEFNPLDINPLRTLIERTVDFDSVHGGHGLKLFIAATNVRTGRVRVFHTTEITADVIMASACLPYLYQAVEIDGEHYWDGGYMGNPVLFPFFYECESADVVLVQINPIERPEVPTSAREIFNRVNEITFNSSLIKELRSIEFVTRLIDSGRLSQDGYKRVLVHRIDGEEFLRPMAASSKLNAEWQFLTHLRDLGRQCTEAWLEQNFDGLGENSTVDLRALMA